MLNKALLILFVLTILLVLMLNYRGFTKKQRETFTSEKDILQDLEVLENTIIEGYFKGTGNELYKFNLDNLEIIFDYKNPKTGLQVNLENIKKNIELPLIKDKLYTFKLAIYPLDNLLLFLFKEEKGEYKLLTILKHSSFSKENQKLITKDYIRTTVQKNDQNLENLKDELFKLSSNNKYLSVNADKIQFLNRNELDDKKTTIWNIEKSGKRPIYTIRNIVNNLFLSIKNGILGLDSVMNSQSRFYIIKNNKNYVIINENGYVLNVEKLEQSNTISETKCEPIENIGNWLTYNSVINLVNGKNLYLSGNINVKYNLTNTSVVYVDELATKELIQWVVEDYFGIKKGVYIKNNDDVYLKNNGKYLQIIKGNNSPSNSGFEISLGDAKNDNSKWVIRNVSLDRLFRNKTEIYFYHPKMNVYLYSTNNLFKVLDKDKLEVIGDKQNYKWKFDIVSSEKMKNLIDDVDYFKFTNDKNYFEIKEKEWRKLLEKENEITKKNLNKYNELVENEKKLLERMNYVQNEISNIEKEKCPPRKVCLEKVHYDCIRKPSKKTKKDNKLYDVVYIKTKEENGDHYVNSDSLKKCMTINDYDIEKSEYIKTKKFVPKKGAKLEITDFNLNEFPEYNDLVSIESIPDDKKIIDFKINELPGFERLKLKSSYK